MTISLKILTNIFEILDVYMDSCELTTPNCLIYFY